jgi:hypothetical protein
VTHLLARTLLGDRFLIKIDSPQYQASFPKLHTSNYEQNENKTSSDLQIIHRSKTTLVPQEIKLGTLQCLNYDICGAAFICNGNICTSEKSKANQLEEHQFAFQTPQKLNLRNELDPSSLAYPIVPLSQLLDDPETYIQRIAKINAEITEKNSHFLEMKNQDLKSQLRQLDNDLIGTKNVLLEIKERLDSEITNLTQAYLDLKEKWKGAQLDPNQLPDPIQAEYYHLLKALAQKKDLRRKLFTAIENAYSSTDALKNIPQFFREEINPVLKEYGRI